MANVNVVAEPEAEAIPRDEGSTPSIEVKTGRAHVLGGVKTTVRMLVGIRPPEVEMPEDAVAVQRPHLQAACVLDCSGSMSGQPLEFAKRAVLKLIKHFCEGDTLHFITYDSVAEVIFRNGDLSETGKEALRESVLNITSKGQTNLFGGLESAASLFQEGAAGLDNNGQSQVRRIFLFSDGCVNVGVTDQHAIQCKVAEWACAGITTSTFGIGTHFDEPLMRGIADSGKGRYTYLATAQDIPKLVSKSVHGLLDMFASEAAIDVRGLLHTTVARVYGADDEDTSTGGKETPGLLVLGDLHRGSERRVLVELEVAPPGGGAEAGCFEAAEWTLTFQREGSLAQFSGKVPLSITSSRSTLGEENLAVRAAFAIQKAADLDLEVSQHLEQNDRIRARDAKARQISLLKETLEALQADGNAQADAEALARVLERAERVSAQMDRGENNEMVRRQCIQEMEMNRCMSDADWRSGLDSDDGNDVANLQDVNSPPSPISSICSSPTCSLAGSPPGSPRSRSPRISPNVFPKLLFFGPANDPDLIQALLPRLQQLFDVTHVDSAPDGIRIAAQHDFRACIAKLGTQGNLGVDVISALRSAHGDGPFVAIHSATASRQPQLQDELKRAHGVNLFVGHGEEDALMNALSELTTTDSSSLQPPPPERWRGLDCTHGHGSTEQGSTGSCVLS